MIADASDVVILVSVMAAFIAACWVSWVYNGLSRHRNDISPRQSPSEGASWNAYANIENPDNYTAEGRKDLRMYWISNAVFLATLINLLALIVRR